jgi:DNA-binding transcriptional ArsR family regulator
MLQNPMSKVVISCSGSWAELAPPYPPSAAGSESAPALRVLRPTERQVLVLLGAHEVLTSGQLVRLTGLPERTVQHRLGLLYRAGLVNRVRPPREIGTSPHQPVPLLGERLRRRRNRCREARREKR